jgi:hypothetical protein
VKKGYLFKSMIFKNRLIFLILFLIMQFINCTGAGNVLFYRAVERGDVDIVHGRAGLVRTVYCDIYIEHVDDEGWKYLKEVDFLRGGGRGNPAPVCFHLIIVNTWNKPFQIDKVEAMYDGVVVQSEDFTFIKDKEYMENRYSVSLASLLKKRRVLSDDCLLKEIDFKNDTAEYRLDFVAPGDKVSFFRFFSWFPVGKSSKIRISIKYFDMKKVIDFDIGRFEYNESIQE